MIKNIEPWVCGAYNGSRAHHENASVKKGEYLLSVCQTTPPLSYLKINLSNNIKQLLYTLYCVNVMVTLSFAATVY